MVAPLRKIIDEAEPDVARGYADSVMGLKSHVVLKDLVAAIERKDIDAVMNLIDVEDAAFSPFRKSLRDAFEAAGQVAAARFTTALKKRKRRGK